MKKKKRVIEVNNLIIQNIKDNMIGKLITVNQADMLITLAKFWHLEDELIIFNYISLKEFSKHRKETIFECRSVLDNLTDRKIINKDKRTGKYQFKLFDSEY
jgi:hypothetical protein